MSLRAGIVVLVVGAAAGAFGQAPSARQKIVADAEKLGAATWDKQCHACHDLPGNLGNPPPRAELAKMDVDEIYLALTEGNMKTVGDYMGEEERQAVAMYLAKRPLSFLLEPPKP